MNFVMSAIVLVTIGAGAALYVLKSNTAGDEEGEGNGDRQGPVEELGRMAA